MKKTLYVALVATLLSLWSCKKESEVISPVSKPKEDVSAVEGRLVFKDRTSFENYSTSLGKVEKGISVEQSLQKMEAKLGFFSMRAADHDVIVKLPNARTMQKAGIEDDYLASMLSPEGIVQIGEWIFKLDIPNEKVYALNEKDQNLIGELKKDTPAHDKIQIFSTDDDVLDLLKSGEKGSPAGRVALFCRESGADRHKDDAIIEYGDGYQLDCKIVYQKAGIYFSLQGKVKNQARLIGGVLLDCFEGHTMAIEHYVKWKPKCRSEEEPGAAIKFSDGNECVLNHRPYESTRGLNKYIYQAVFINYPAGVRTRLFQIIDGY